MSNFKNHQSYIYLIIGFAFLFFSNGRWIIPGATFLAPLFLIRFYRFHKTLKGLLFIILAGWVSNFIIWKGMLPMSGVFYYFLAFMMSVFTSLTFLLERVFTLRITGLVSTFMFRASYVLMEFIVVYANPSGSYGTLAHTQSSLQLLQIVSLTGIWGVVFFITWTSSLINWLWDNSFERSKIKTAFLVYGIPIGIILLFGQARLSIDTNGKTVRIASINVPKSSFENRYYPIPDSISEKANILFLKNCEIASYSGAKVVFGIETAVRLNKDIEDVFISKAIAVAKKESIYLGLPMEVIPKDYPNLYPENKIVWISPKGQILLTYHKAKPTPGEGNYGDGTIKYFDSPFGRISSAICFDMDFPSLINQVRKMNIDIMLVPGNDWHEITPYHTYVASARAIEHGFNLVRATSRGVSASFNYKGQVLSFMDYFNTDDLIMYSDVPTKGRTTIYSILGNYFAYLCIIFLLFMALKAIKKTKIASS